MTVEELMDDWDRITGPGHDLTPDQRHRLRVLSVGGIPARTDDLPAYLVRMQRGTPPVSLPKPKNAMDRLIEEYNRSVPPCDQLNADQRYRLHALSRGGCVSKASLPRSLLPRRNY
ncbi:MAG: hypothetical protein Q7R96_06490 [Nanoarchaeota archaeon]|nr:hypothetical protein [Nanoarchaeota archaeon]